MNQNEFEETDDVLHKVDKQVKIKSDGYKLKPSDISYSKEIKIRDQKDKESKKRKTKNSRRQVMWTVLGLVTMLFGAIAGIVTVLITNFL